MSTWYPQYLQALLTRPANSDPVAGTLKFRFYQADYVYSAAHDFLDDVSGTAVGAAVTAGGVTKTFTDGIMTLDVPDVPALPAGPASQALVWLDTGVASTSRLVMHIDDAPVFPLTGLGLDQPTTWTPQLLCNSTGGSPANIWYPKFAEALFTRPANSDLSAGTVKVVGVNLTGAGTTYTYSAAHDFLDDVAAGALIGTGQTLANKTFTNGIFDADNVTFPSLAGDSIEALLAYIDTGVAATSRLVGLIRTAQGLPLTPVGSNQPVAWNAGGVLVLGATA